MSAAEGAWPEEPTPLQDMWQCVTVAVESEQVGQLGVEPHWSPTPGPHLLSPFPFPPGHVSWRSPRLLRSICPWNTQLLGQRCLNLCPGHTHRRLQWKPWKVGYTAPKICQVRSITSCKNYLILFLSPLYAAMIIITIIITIPYYSNCSPSKMFLKFCTYV